MYVALKRQWYFALRTVSNTGKIKFLCCHGPGGTGPGLTRSAKFPHRSLPVPSSLHGFSGDQVLRLAGGWSGGATLLHEGALPGSLGASTVVSLECLEGASVHTDPRIGMVGQGLTTPLPFPTDGQTVRLWADQTHAEPKKHVVMCTGKGKGGLAYAGYCAYSPRSNSWLKFSSVAKSLSCRQLRAIPVLTMCRQLRTLRQLAL